MTTFLVLDDHLSTAGLLTAGQLVSDSDYDITRLVDAGAALVPYSAAMEPFIVGWRAQADLNPQRPSLGLVLLVAGFFFGSGSGDFVGPAGATPDAVLLFNGPTGKLGKNSVVTINGAGDIVTPGTVDGRDVSDDGAALDAVVAQSAATSAGLASHVADTGNPHATTAAQVGAVPVTAHAATSVVGRSAGSVGDAADIAAGVDDRLLARAGGVLGFVQVALGMIPDALITLAKMAASAADQAASIASLRTLGTTSVQACAGDDARLSDSRAPNGAASGQLGGTYPGPDVRGVRETDGPTLLTIGVITDGQMLQRVGTVLQGVTSSVASLPSLVYGAGSVAATTTTRYLVPGYDAGVAPTAAVAVPVTRSATIRRLFVRHNTPAGNGAAIVYTVRKNGVAQALSVSLASTGSSGSDVANSFTVVAGDALDIEVTKAAGVGTSPGDVVAAFEVM